MTFLLRIPPEYHSGSSRRADFWTVSHSDTGSNAARFNLLGQGLSVQRGSPSPLTITEQAHRHGFRAAASGERMIRLPSRTHRLRRHDRSSGPQSVRSGALPCRQGGYPARSRTEVALGADGARGTGLPLLVGASVAAPD